MAQNLAISISFYWYISDTDVYAKMENTYHKQVLFETIDTLKYNI